ncbi:hypothetical protein TWF694_002086 [Orbilia ellipsospora]|uniref:Uncharacterized protein n=1 Tax=Orbilia ellipsospora TaxID=2528407 RepID=A0AAV9X5N3_9PEZI
MELSVSVPYLEAREQGAPYISRSLVPENIKLASINIGVLKPGSPLSTAADSPSSVGESSDSELPQLARMITPPDNRRKGHYALKSTKQVMMDSGELVEVKVPEILLLTATEVGEVKILDNLRLKIDRIDDESDSDGVITFDMLNEIQKTAAIEWSGCNPDGSEYDNSLTLGWKKMRRVLDKYELQFEERSQIMKWARGHEVVGLRRYIETQPVFEQAVTLLQRFRRLFNETLQSEAEDHPAASFGSTVFRTIWVQFGIESTISRPAYQRSLLRVKATAHHPRHLDAREALNIMDWDKANDLCPIHSSILGTFDIPFSYAEERKRKRQYSTSSEDTSNLDSHTNCETERCREISPISIYADTECRSPRTEEENAAYKARHAIARMGWPQYIRDSYNAERQPSPSPSSSENELSDKEDGIEEDEWPVLPGVHGTHYHGRFSGVVEMVAGGVPGGMDFGLVRSDGWNSMRGATRRLKNEASFRPPGSPRSEKRRERKRLKEFPPHEIIGMVTEQNVGQVLHVIHNDGEDEHPDHEPEEEEVFDDALQEEQEE